MGPWKNVSGPFTEPFTEGPSVVKVGDEWLIYFDSYRKKTYEAVSTKDFKNFSNADNRISIPEGHKHGTILEVKKSLVKKLVKKMKA